MPDLTDLLESSLTDEPHYQPDVPGIMAAARRRQRARRTAVVASGVALGVGIGGLAVALVAGGPAPNSRPAAQAPLERTAVLTSAPAASSHPVPARSGSGADVHGITRDNLARLVEQGLGVRLSGVDVTVLQPVSDIDLSAGLASAQGQYLNVQVAPAGTSPTAKPTCADLSGDGPDGDGYTGPCSVKALSGGGYLVVRSGRTANDRYAKTQADLVAADGSAITAESTNQLSAAKHSPAPVVTRNPPLTTAQLRDLVLGLNSHR